MDLDRVDDQFLIGRAIMQAPIVHQGQQSRLVTLPGTGRWMDASSGQFLAAGRTIHVTSSADSTPIYLREGTLIPMQPGVRTSAAYDLADIELHVILGSGSPSEATLDYVADDGLSFGYLRGARSVYRLHARRAGNSLELNVSVVQSGWKPLRLRVVGYDGADHVALKVGREISSLTLVHHTWRLSGGEFCAAISEPVSI